MADLISRAQFARLVAWGLLVVYILWTGELPFALAATVCDAKIRSDY